MPYFTGPIVQPKLLREFLHDIQAGRVSVDDAMSRLAHMPFESLDFANIDHHRAMRCGFPEVLFCPGKTTQQIVAIYKSLAAAGGNVLATRATGEQFKAVQAACHGVEFHEAA